MSIIQVLEFDPNTNVMLNILIIVLLLDFEIYTCIIIKIRNMIKQWFSLNTIKISDSDNLP